MSSNFLGTDLKELNRNLFKIVREKSNIAKHTTAIPEVKCFLYCLDGVAVVLYNMMNTFAEMVHSGVEVTPTEISLGLVSFLTVALGGLAVGIVMGFITALITKSTSEVRGTQYYL